jgi:arabinan endo-1,5-alpha-L-arabinosidase
LGDALPQKPRWGASKQNFWAPHVIYDRGRERYFMYYSAETDQATGKCLAVATADAPGGPFNDSGSPLLCGEKIENIDPMAFDDPQTGKRLLYWGSGFRPIRVQELSPDRLRFLPGSSAVDLLQPGPDRRSDSLIEAPWVQYREGVYYLFYSRGLCCGPEANYRLEVARSSSALGPFEPLSRPVLEHNGFWRAPGHGSIVSDAEGADWLLYHAMDAARTYFVDAPAGRSPARVMLADPIRYLDGWPWIEHGAPSVTRRPAPAPWQ